MPEAFSRMALLYGEAAMERLKCAHVAVFGIGGVGGYVVEALTRSGIGALDLIDHDRVSLSNLNRQIIATRSSIGRYKVDVAEERINDINPNCRVRTYRSFYLPDTADTFDFRDYDYVVDAVDTVTAKLLLAQTAQKAGIPIISAMGTGNKLHPEMLEVADLYETSECPLARIMRKEARKRGLRQLKVVYSRERPLTPGNDQKETAHTENQNTDPGEPQYGNKRVIPGSTAFVPAAAGLLLASVVINDLTDAYRQKVTAII